MFLLVTPYEAEYVASLHEQLILLELPSASTNTKRRESARLYPSLKCFLFLYAYASFPRHLAPLHGTRLRTSFEI